MVAHIKMIFVGILIFLILIGICIFCGLHISKDKAIENYDSIVHFFGENTLTKDKNLKGTRKFGVDKYVGTYNVEYEDFTGEEILFGGTGLSRKNGDHIHIKFDISNSDGKIEVVMRYKDTDKVIATEDGDYDWDSYVEGASSYFIIKTDHYSGKLDVEIN